MYVFIRLNKNNLGRFRVYFYIAAGDSLARSHSVLLPTWLSSLGQNTNEVVGLFVRSRVIERL